MVAGVLPRHTAITHLSNLLSPDSSCPGGRGESCCDVISDVLTREEGSGEDVEVVSCLCHVVPGPVAGRQTGLAAGGGCQSCTDL